MCLYVLLGWGYLVLWSGPKDQVIEETAASEKLIGEIVKIIFFNYLSYPFFHKIFHEIIIIQNTLGVFINNYQNFLLWLNVVDQLKLVSVEEGRDLRLELLLLIYTGKKTWYWSCIKVLNTMSRNSNKVLLEIFSGRSFWGWNVL